MNDEPGGGWDWDAAQHGQLAALVDWTIRFGQRSRLPAKLAANPLNAALWREIPVLERATVQAHGAELRCTGIPEGHGPVGEITTSGSTGRPVTVARTAHSLKHWDLCALREHEWHRRDLRGTLAVIRWFRDGVNDYPGTRLPSWGPPIGSVHQTGPGHALSITATSAQQAEWLQRVQPHYLLLFPSLLPELVRECRSRRIRLHNLQHVRTVGESVDPDVRALCREEWGVPVHDVYSAHEVGYVALQCPESENYHVMSDCVYVEVLDQAGQRCRPGEIGRVVVTPLHNYAMPLIRYALGDYAEVGEICPCGRPLPVLARVLGRARNMLTLPNGDRVWPRLSELRYAEVLPVTQFQVVQTAVNQLCVKLVSGRRGEPEDEQQLRRIITGRLGHPFSVTFEYVDSIARGPAGKFEDFRSEL